MTNLTSALSWADVPGMLGFTLYAVAYLLVATNRLKGHETMFFALNGAGAVFVLVGLQLNFNLGAMLVQVFYLTVSGATITARLWRRPVETPADT